MAHESGNGGLHKNRMQVPLTPSPTVTRLDVSRVEIVADGSDALVRDHPPDDFADDGGLRFVDQDALIFGDVALAIADGRNVVEAVAGITAMPAAITSAVLGLGPDLLTDVVAVFGSLLGGFPQLRAANAGIDIPAANAWINGVERDLEVELVYGVEQFFKLARAPVQPGELAGNDHVDESGAQISHEVQELATRLLTLVAGTDAVVHVDANELPAL
jgi:hypothetical protein